MTFEACISIGFQRLYNTINFFTNQLDEEQYTKVDIKMSTLKSKMCSWLFSAWLHIFNKQGDGYQGMEKCDLLYSFDQDFQREAMMDNMKTPFFKHIEDNQIIEHP